MKNALLGIVVVLQLAILVLIGGETLRARQNKKEEPAFEKIDSSLRNLSAALNQQRQFNDQLRRQMEDLRSEAANPAGAAPSGPASIGPEPRPTVEALGGSGAIQELQLLLSQREEASESGVLVLSPFDRKIEEARARLLSYGLDALYWVSIEVTRQPYDSRRDPALIEMLLREVVPPISSLDKEGDAFELARDALLTVTNENAIRLAGAWVLKEIAPDRWQKEYADVIRQGGARNRDITLRLALLNAFSDAPWANAVPLCQGFIANIGSPISLRTKSVQVLSRQDSPLIEPTLRTALFEDHAPEIRLHSLDALHRLLGDSAPLRNLLREILDQDAATMHGQVREKARLLLVDLEGAEPGQQS